MWRGGGLSSRGNHHGEKGTGRCRGNGRLGGRRLRGYGLTLGHTVGGMGGGEKVLENVDL